MAVINRKLQEAEKEYTDGCKTIDEKADAQIRQVEIERVDNKECLADRLVSEITNKIL